MLKRKIAMVVGGLLLGAGSAIAADSAFPRSTNEVTSSEWHQGNADTARRQTGNTTIGMHRSAFPSSVSEVSPSEGYNSGDTERRDISNRMTRYGVPAFPTSSNEVTAYQ